MEDLRRRIRNNPLLQILPHEGISDGVEELLRSSPPPQGSVEPFGNPGPQRAPIAPRRGRSYEFHAKRGEFHARVLSPGFILEIQSVPGILKGAVKRKQALLDGESGISSG